MYQHLNHRGAKRRRGRARNGNLFEKIMKENFPSLAKEIDFQEAERVPKKLNARHIIVKLPKIKDKIKPERYQEKRR